MPGEFSLLVVYSGMDIEDKLLNRKIKLNKGFTVCHKMEKVNMNLDNSVFWCFLIFNSKLPQRKHRLNKKTKIGKSAREPRNP